MVQKTLLLWLVASVVGVCSCVLLPILALAQNQVSDELSEIVDAEVKYDLFSGSVLVAKDGEIIFSGGYGEANKDYHIRTSPETKFNISSVQKTFIATLLMQLFQEGVVGLDDPLTKYYPECPWPTAGQIRIKHLLNHTSGLGDYRDNDEYQANSEQYTTIEEVLPLVWKYEPAFTPGERARYSNAGILLIKGVIEKTTGKRLKEALYERIWQPLGMSNTTMFIGGDVLDHRATAYRLGIDGVSYKRIMGEPSAYAGGGIYTTVGDLLLFDQALYGDRLLDERHKQIMFTPVEASPNYAYGWIIYEIGGVDVISHSGGSGGFNTEFRRYTDNGYTLVVMSNYEGGAWMLADKIERLLVGLPYELATEADMIFKRGMHLQSHDAFSEAMAVFEKNCEHDNPHMPSLYQAARTRILAQMDQATAITLLDRYIALADDTSQPSIGAAWWRKGVAYEQMGEIERAIECHQTCLELDAGFEDAAEALTRLQAGN